MRQSKQFSRILQVVAGVWVSLAAAGCAPSNSANSANPVAPAGAQASAERSQPTVVRIGYLKWGLLPAVRQRGSIERELAAQNIQVEWSGPFPAFAPALEALNAGSIDLSAGGDIPGISGLAGGIPMCLLAYRPAVPLAEAILVRGDSDIQSPADLVGKKVAVNRGGWGEHLLLKVLEQAQVPKEKVERVYMGPTDALPALTQGHVEAWAIWDPALSITEVEHGTRRIASGEAAPHYGIYVAREQALTEKAAAIQAVLAAIQREGQWATDQPTEAAAVLQQALKLSAEAAKQTVTHKPVEQVLPLDSRVLTDLQNSADWMLEQKAIPKRVEVAAAVCPSPTAQAQTTP